MNLEKIQNGEIQMKDEIKTFAEYKALAKEYKESDSISRKNSIKNVIFGKAEELLHKLIALYAKYGKDYVDDSEFIEDRGELLLTGIDEDEVWMNYSDHWAYGGSCDIDIDVQMKYLDDAEIAALEKELHEERMSDVKRLIQEKKEAIEQLKKEFTELEAELEAEEKLLKIS